MTREGQREVDGVTGGGTLWRYEGAIPEGHKYVCGGE
jgi:hypothetical protein